MPKNDLEVKVVSFGNEKCLNLGEFVKALPVIQMLEESTTGVELEFRKYAEGVAIYHSDMSGTYHMGNIFPAYPTPEKIKTIQSVLLKPSKKGENK